jgi:predicted metal-dependent peptidase
VEEVIDKAQLVETTAQTIISENLQWAVSMRGGNNFLGRVLNGCKFIPQPGLGTAGVLIGKSGRNVFTFDPEWMVKQTRPYQILVFLHEGAHLALNHLPRFLRLRKVVNNDLRYARRHAVLNVAADMAVNDTAIRVFVEQHAKIFREHAKTLILPEERNYPKGESFEAYAHLLFQDLKDHGWTPDDMDDYIEEIKRQLSGQGDQDDSQQGDGEGQQEKQEGAGEGEEEQQAAPGDGEKSQDGKKKPQKGQPGGDSGDGQQQPQDAKGDGSGGEPEEDDGTPGTGYGGGYDPQQDPGLPDWFKAMLARQHPPIDISQVWDTMSESEMERAIDDAQREGKKLVKAALDQTKKHRGLIPAALQDFLDEFLTPPTVPWEHLFRGMLRSSITSRLNESTVMPNVALLPVLEEGIEPFPGLQKEVGINIVVCVDSSGSVSNEEYRKFMSEIQGILKADNTAKAYLIIFDAAIQHEMELEADDEIQTPGQEGLERYCAGGTDFNPALKRVLGIDEERDWEPSAQRLERRLPRPDVVVMFTDGYAPVTSPGGPIPDLLPSCPLLWALTPDGKDDPAMGGRVVKIQE